MRWNMNWEGILEFIRSKDPDFLSSARGVPAEVIREVEETYRIALPRAYVQFLSIMGESSGSFPPFAVAQNHGFSELLEQLPDSLPEGRYFKVSFADDEQLITPVDYFLDLARRDAEDAALVMFEQGCAVDTGSAIDCGLTFGEYISMQVFSFFEFDRRAQHSAVLVFHVSPDQGPGRVAAGLTLLATLGFSLTFPPLPRVACLERDGLAALIFYQQSVTLSVIDIGGDEAPALKAMVEQVRNGTPNGKVRGTDGNLQG
jgi:hypothetical protein